MLRQALAKAPADRFNSARDFAAALRRLAQASQTALDDSELVPWLSALGVLPSRSGTHEVTRLPSTLQPTAPPPAPSPRPVLRPTTAVPPPMSRHIVPAAPMPRLPFGRALVELPALVFAIALNGDTGELHLEGTHGELRLAFEDGKLVAPHRNGAEMVLRGLFAFGDGTLRFTLRARSTPCTCSASPFCRW